MCVRKATFFSIDLVQFRYLEIKINGKECLSKGSFSFSVQRGEDYDTLLKTIEYKICF